jgi:hypothetical protein
MSISRQTGIREGGKLADTNRKTAIKESNMKISASNLIRWAGLAAMVAGIFYVVLGLFHPLNVLSSVTTTRWEIVHILASAMSFFGLFGMVGLYARQADKSGWLGLAGFVLFSLWLALVLGFTFVETFILPPLATVAPKFVEGFLGIFTGSASEINFGILPTLWTLSGPLYILGGLLFGIATFRAGILPRWAGGLLAFGTALAPLAALLPPELEAKIAVPVGLALAWMGYALWAERRAPASQSVPGGARPISVNPEPSKVA